MEQLELASAVDQAVGKSIQIDKKAFSKPLIQNLLDFLYRDHNNILDM